MKKILLFALLALCLASCGSDNGDEPEVKNAKLDVKELTAYIGQTADYVKANFKSGHFITQTGSLGKVNLSYLLATKGMEYSVNFKSDTKGVVSEIDVHGTYSNYDKGIEAYKAEVDNINATIPHVTYIAYYNSPTAGLMAFQDRKEFWDYVADKGVSTFINEIWSIENTATVKFDVEATFTRSSSINSNSISIEIEKKVWD